MVKSFKAHIKNAFPFLENSKLLLAISGGVDSVVLAYLCDKIGLNFSLAHCNFNLRGSESDADEAFVEALAEKLGVPIFVQDFETLSYAETSKLSTQMAARELRYNWFKDLAAQLQFQYILTAHHADDNLETVLINLTRGTGLDGLMGIPQQNDAVVRPLLPFSRDQIVAFAKSEGISWRDDSSNASTKYTRNKIRHEVVPILKEINPSLLSSLQKTIQHLQEAQSIQQDCIDQVSKAVLEKSKGGVLKINIKKIQQLSHPKAYLRALLKDYHFSEWDDVCALLEAQSGKQVLSTTHRIVKHRDVLLVSEHVKNEAPLILVDEGFETLEIPLGTLFFNEVSAVKNTSVNTVYIDQKKIKYPLILRKWREGDVFYPFGMKGKKKLSKYFKDEKFSLLEKENTWLLCSGDYIIWVVGKRADNRFKITPKTCKILKIELQP